MHVSTIQSSLDTLLTLMLSRGITPSVELTIRAGETPRLNIWYFKSERARSAYSPTSHYISESSVAEALAKAEAYILDLPTSAEQEEQQYLELLAATAEQGKKIGAKHVAEILAILAASGGQSLAGPGEASPALPASPASPDNEQTFSF